jgi:non-specific serine/threonine protein kinase/serine/threonine-protein kinase
VLLAMTTGECIEEDALLAFVDHQLAAADVARVTGHVASCIDCRRVLAELVREPPGLVEVEPLRKGSRLGRYVLAEQLGAGGMGVVYAAEDPTLGRRVALKLLRDSGGDRASRSRRFEHERRVLARLEHPHIARLLDGGEAADGRPYLVMELVDGAPLGEFCDAHRLTIDDRLHLFRQVCGAVQFAHQNLVVHRDLKPSNILVTAAGSPRLLDFGIAKLLDPDDDTARLTATGLQPMTPAFASPEQVRHEPITTASDVYALGVVLYELLTGLSPYGPGEPTLDELLRAVRDHEPEKPSLAIARAKEVQVLARESSRERLARKLGGDLDSIVAMALRKEPRERYATPDALSEDLRRHLEGQPTKARRGSTAYRLSRFVRRHKAGVVAGLVAVSSLGAGTVATAWQAHVAAQERDRAERRFTQVRQLAHAVLFDYHDGIAQLEGSTTLRERLVKDALGYLNSLAGEAADDPSLQRELVSAYLKVGDVQGDPFGASLGDTAGALASYRRAQALAAAMSGDLEATRLLATSYLKVGDLLAVTGDGAGALLSYRMAIALNERLPGPEDRVQLGLDLFALGSALADQGQLDEALTVVRRSLTLREEALKVQPTEALPRRRVAGTHILLGDVYAKRAESDPSLREYLLGFEQYEALVRDAPVYRSDLAPLYQRVGIALRDSGQLERGVELLRKGMESAEARLKSDPADTVAKRNLAGAYSTLGDTLQPHDAPGALASYRKAIVLSRELSAGDPANTQLSRDLAVLLYQLGRGARLSGELELALTSQTEALQLTERLLALSATVIARADVADVLVELGRVKSAKKGWILAQADQQRALTLYEQLVLEAPRHAGYLTARAQLAGELGDTWLALGNRQNACAMFGQAKAAWLELKTLGLLSGEDLSRPDAADRAFAACPLRAPPAQK